MNSPIATDSPRIIRSIGEMLGAAAAFATMNAIAKMLGGSLPPTEVAFARVLVNALVLAPWMWGHNISFLGTRRKVLATRSVSGTTALAFNFTAAATLPLADLGALLKSGVLFTVALSALVLRERVSSHRWVLVSAGFAGVLLVLQPTLAGDLYGGLAALGAALFGSVSAIAIRELKDSEHPCTVIFQFSAYGTVILGALFGSGFVWPQGSAWLLLLGCGLAGSLGQVLVTTALHRAPASLVAPYSFSEVLFAALLGMVLFNESLSSTTLWGALVIVVSGVMLGRGAVRESRRSK